MTEYRIKIAHEYGLGWYDCDTKLDERGICQKMPELRKLQHGYGDKSRPSAIGIEKNKKASFRVVFEKTLKACAKEDSIKLLPIVQPDGKIRVATLNNASVNLIARSMTNVLVPYLKNFAITRDALRGKRVRLTNYHSVNQIIYSADLSKSTDPISIDTAKFVLNEIVKHTGAPSWWAAAVKAVIKPFRFDESDGGEVTTCGALMGLGPGWTVLNVLNSFAARKAGAHRNSYRVCGDDLSALWTVDQCDRYEANIAELGLQSNYEKSFRSPKYGVFCERFVIRSGPYSAYADTCLRIGEATGARALDNSSGVAIVDTLMNVSGHNVLMRAARRTAIRSALRVGITGPLSRGGRGTGKITAATLVSYALFGPTPISVTDTDPRIKSMREGLRIQPLDPKGPSSAADVLIHAMTEIEMESRMQGRLGSRPSALRRDAIERTLLLRQRKVNNLLRTKGAIGTFKELHAKGIGRPLWADKINNILHFIRNRAFTKAMKVLSSSWDKKVSAQGLSQLYLEKFPKHRPSILSNFRPAPEVWCSRESR
jgi:hypothetical protein